MDAARAKELLLDALERPAAERAAYLRAACGGDEALHRRVVALLAAHAQADGRIGPSPASWTALADLSGLERPAGEPPRAADLGVGDAIGPYRLVSHLGDGGFGTVYRAEQQRPVRRQVALKIVKRGMDTRAVIARFELERQALAVMDHPHIARVLDAGATDDGRPFFVMELVDGPPLTVWCEQHALGLRERLGLFARVCHAIQHAHGRGVIHRDVKPGNVLVGTVDGQPVPKVIDFGIAKAIEPSLAGETAFTREGHLIGTPASMSPEQIEGAGDVDVRTDVYALGALLYELVTGSPPFDARGRTLHELRRLVRDVDPPRPAERLRALRAEGLPGAAAVHALPPEVDWIAMRCLEKERSRRYPTAAALALDVERFLDERPVEAAPPSTWYRVRKLARRHRAATGAAVAVALALLLGAAGALAGLLEARRANARLDVALTEARDEARRARAAEAEAAAQAGLAGERARIHDAVMGFLLDDLLGAVAPSVEPGRGRDARVRDVLDVASRRIGVQAAPGGRLHAAPLVVAHVHAAIGGAYRALGLLEPADEHLRAAIEGLGPEEGPAGPAAMEARLSLADVQRLRGELDAAERSLDALLGRQRELLGADDVHTLATLRLLGLVVLEQGRAPQAEAILREARALAATRFGADDPATLEAEADLAILLAAAGRADEAEALFRHVHTARGRAASTDDPDALASAVNLANLLRTTGRTDEAETLYAGALAAFERVSGPDHPDTIATLQGLGWLRLEQGRLDEAEALLRDALERARRVHGEAQGETLDIQTGLGRVLELAGRLDEAEQLYVAAWAASHERYGALHPDTLLRATAVASVTYHQGRLDEAEALGTELVAGFERVSGREHPDTLRALRNLAIVLIGLGREGEAEALLREALARGAAEQRSLLALEVQSDLAALLCGAGRFAEAEPFARRAYDAALDQLPDTSRDLATHRVRLATALIGLERFEEAEHLLHAAHDVLDEHFGEQDMRTIDAVEKLAWLYLEWGRADEAAVWRARLELLEPHVEHGSD